MHQPRAIHLKVGRFAIDIPLPSLPEKDSPLWPLIRIFSVFAFGILFLYDTATQFDATELECLTKLMFAVSGIELGAKWLLGRK